MPIKTRWVKARHIREEKKKQLHKVNVCDPLISHKQNKYSKFSTYIKKYLNIWWKWHRKETWICYLLILTFSSKIDTNNKFHSTQSRLWMNVFLIHFLMAQTIFNKLSFQLQFKNVFLIEKLFPFSTLNFK